MNREEALSWVHGTLKFGSKLGLENIRYLMDKLGNPQRQLKIIHVAGTNGKGSTSACIERILREAGYKTGLFTSPFIQRFEERIRIQGAELSEEHFIRLTEKVRGCVDEIVKEGRNHPTEFEIVTAIGFLAFAETQCDWTVLEVGLGGRFDATNVIETPDIAVITTISLDHTEYLGTTLPEIAGEKAGIMKAGGTVVVRKQSEEVMQVFRRRAAELGCVLAEADVGSAGVVRRDRDSQTVLVDSFGALETGLLGAYQHENIALAVRVIMELRNKGASVSDGHIRDGLKYVVWPGRFERISEYPDVYIDGAHNAEGIEALAASVRAVRARGQKVCAVFGVLGDKDSETMIRVMNPLVESYWCVTPPTPRALPADELAERLRCSGAIATACQTTGEALEKARQDAGPDGLVIAFGSLYYIGEVRTLCGKLYIEC